jgi:nitrate reductase NapAB chaperone NapD
MSLLLGERICTHHRPLILCGLIVHTQPARREDVRRRLDEMGVEVREVIGDHQLMVVVHSDVARREEDVRSEIMNIKGVTDVIMAYHYFGGID